MSIAIVDDDEAVREAMESLVLPLGHSVSTFGSAEEFLNSEQISRTSCLVTDLHMPGLSGLDCKTGCSPKVIASPLFSSLAIPMKTCGHAP